ncbi:MULTISPECIES: MbtH family NRPS accessory protein [unclassified Plantactinospora]|uniref:MbtH family protein n=1 Tax=unclassified Plantactinospora TaxID=2631981 RepID=UPI000D169D6F|nr:MULTISPECIES: MbtH family NRPS accessory protein [unclassified Plantactinospora]AVT32030.1 MbtH family protein [Plantactinospora sp. BC1]AVT40934.1 MbtH family protein [Plantactinospora sp. BB1]
MSEVESPRQRGYEVVRNHEGQYSIFPQGRPVPPGWELVGRAGSEEECLGYIEEVWTDMTPRSVRRRLDEASRGR